MGFAVGLERLIEIMKTNNLQLTTNNLQLFIAVMGEEARKKGFELLKASRDQGIRADMDHSCKGLKAQLKTADRLKAKYVYIIGEDELKKGEAVLKNMRDGSQKEISFNDLAASLK